MACWCWKLEAAAGQMQKLRVRLRAHWGDVTVRALCDTIADLNSLLCDSLVQLCPNDSYSCTMTPAPQQRLHGCHRSRQQGCRCGVLSIEGLCVPQPVRQRLRRQTAQQRRPQETASRSCSWAPRTRRHLRPPQAPGPQAQLRTEAVPIAQETCHLMRGSSSSRRCRRQRWTRFYRWVFRVWDIHVAEDAAEVQGIGSRCDSYSEALGRILQEPPALQC